MEQTPERETSVGVEMAEPEAAKKWLNGMLMAKCSHEQRRRLVKEFEDRVGSASLSPRALAREIYDGVYRSTDDYPLSE